MAQKISIEAALESYKERAATLLHENVLLTARVSELEAEVARLQPQDSPAVEPVGTYPGEVGYEPGRSGI